MTGKLIQYAPYQQLEKTSDACSGGHDILRYSLADRLIEQMPGGDAERLEVTAATDEYCAGDCDSAQVRKLWELAGLQMRQHRAGERALCPDQEYDIRVDPSRMH